MKRLFIALSLCLACLTGAAQNSVGFVDIDVELQRNGDARITEIWNVDIDSDNSEWYLCKYDLAQGSVCDLRVSDLLTGEVYETLDKWNVDLGRERKAGKCGIVDKGYSSRYELCWGVGFNGPHRWKAEYTHKNLMVAYTDSCAFNHMFISTDMASAPDSACVTIRYPEHELTDSVASVWAFGFHGYVAYENGTIVARTTEPLNSKSGIVLMAVFEKDLFEPATVSEDDFAVMKKKALKNSDYAGKPWWKKLLTGLAVVAAIIFAILLYYVGPDLIVVAVEILGMVIIPLIWKILTLYPLRRYSRRRKLFRGTSRWRRDIPSGNMLSQVPQVMGEYSFSLFPAPERWDRKLTAAYIMKLILEGGLRVHRELDPKTGKMEALLAVNPDWEGPKDGTNINDAKSMRCLYEIIRIASGDDLILQKGEMKQYRAKNGKAAIKEFYEVRRNIPVTVNDEKSREVFGLYNFLKEFSLLNEKGVVDVALWNDYLVYATVFGIADRVMKQMKEVAPDYFKMSDVGQLFDIDGTMLLTTGALYTVSDRIYDRFSSTTEHFSNLESVSSWGGFSSTASGGGGWSSFGGGGGHTGGGGGGGR